MDFGKWVEGIAALLVGAAIVNIIFFSQNTVGIITATGKQTSSVLGTLETPAPGRGF